MAARKVHYVAIHAPNRAGQAAAVLRAVAEAGISLQAFTGFPEGGGRSQLDLVTDQVAKLRRVAKAEGWKLSTPKRGLLIQGRDRVGAVAQRLAKLAQRGINVTAVDAVAAGGRRFGMILWVKPRDFAKAARALGAR